MLSILKGTTKRDTATLAIPVIERVSDHPRHRAIVDKDAELARRAQEREDRLETLRHQLATVGTRMEAQSLAGALLDDPSGAFDDLGRGLVEEARGLERELHVIAHARKLALQERERVEREISHAIQRELQPYYRDLVRRRLEVATAYAALEDEEREFRARLLAAGATDGLLHAIGLPKLGPASDAGSRLNFAVRAARELGLLDD